jgi:hypothetical protein
VDSNVFKNYISEPLIAQEWKTAKISVPLILQEGKTAKIIGLLILQHVVGIVLFLSISTTSFMFEKLIVEEYAVSKQIFLKILYLVLQKNHSCILSKSIVNFIPGGGTAVVVKAAFSCSSAFAVKNFSSLF